MNTKAKRILKHAENYVYSQFRTDSTELPKYGRYLDAYRDAIAILQQLRWEL